MDILLLIAFYAAYGVFILRFLLHALLWTRGLGRQPQAAAGRRLSAGSVLLATGDLLFFTRLLRSNAALWAAEWLFHGSLLLVLLRHLRFLLEPVPEWVAAVQPWGLAAGYVLPVSLVLIMVIRFAARREISSSRPNLVLLAALLVISATGLLLRTVWRSDLAGIKEFLVSALSFLPAPWPGGALATVHFVLVLAIVPYLPTHIFTAPLTIVDARLREEGLREVLHGK